jgi:hypothetical protein
VSRERGGEKGRGGEKCRARERKTAVFVILKIDVIVGVVGRRAVIVVGKMPWTWGEKSRGRDS